jgi:uncharacterized membrane protein YfcA
MNWVTVRRTAAVTAAYNLFNSAAALIGAYKIWGFMPAMFPIWALAAGIGGTVGVFIGSRYLPDSALRYILAIILFGSGIKLIFA